MSEYHRLYGMRTGDSRRDERVTKLAADMAEHAAKQNELCSESENKQNPLNHQEGGVHYLGLAIQPVEFIQANKLSFLEGCVIKRVCRHRNKAGAEDIRKAIHELQLILQMEYPDEL